MRLDRDEILLLQDIRNNQKDDFYD